MGAALPTARGCPGPEAARGSISLRALPAPAPASPTRPTPLLEAEARRGLLSPTGLWPNMAWKRQTSTSGLHTTTASSAGTPGSGAEAAAAAAAATAAAAAATAAAVPGPAAGSGGFSTAAAAPPSASPMAAPSRAVPCRAVPPRGALCRSPAAAPGGRRGGLGALPALCWRGGSSEGFHLRFSLQLLPNGRFHAGKALRASVSRTARHCFGAVIFFRNCWCSRGNYTSCWKSAELTSCARHLRHENVSFGKKENVPIPLWCGLVFFFGWLAVITTGDITTQAHARASVTPGIRFSSSSLQILILLVTLK